MIQRITLQDFHNIITEISIIKFTPKFNLVFNITIIFEKHIHFLYQIISFSLSCENTQYIDLDGFFDLGWDLMEGGYKCENGIMSVLDKSGLGVY